MKIFEKITLRDHYRKKYYKEAYTIVADLIRSEFPPDVKTGKFIVDGDITLKAPLIVYGQVQVGRKATKKKPATLTLKGLMIFTKRKGYGSSTNTFNNCRFNTTRKDK